MSEAVLSPCGTYRYALGRGEGWPRCGVVMLNPSKADAEVDDPTIRKLKGFVSDWGYSGFVVGNLYAARATDPRDLGEFVDPVGPMCDPYLSWLAACPMIVVAWGNKPPGFTASEHAERVAYVVAILRSLGSSLMCLGRNADGSPKHPLYVPYSRKLEPWPT